MKMKIKHRFAPAPPPRRVPHSVRRMVVFGGMRNQFIWLGSIVGFVCFCAFGLNSDYTSFFIFRGDVQKAVGTAIEVVDSGYSQGGGRGSRGTPIYETRYEFPAPDGKKHKGTSYSVGDPPEKGDLVTVEFPKGNPDASRIEGMRRKPSSMLAGIVASILWLAMLLITGLYVIQGHKAKRLLRTGKAARGTLKSIKDINAGRLSRGRQAQPYYRMEFEFTADDGKTYIAKCDTMDAAPLEDQPTEPLLYDSRNPSHAVMLGALPGDPDFDEHGNILNAGCLRSLLILILPGLSLLMNGILVMVGIVALIGAL